MPTHLETVDLDRARQEMIDKAIPLVMEAFQTLGDTLGNREVTQGELDEEIQRLHPDKKMETGMGTIPSALDALAEAGKVTCIETPIDPGNIGKLTWGVLSYRLPKQPQTDIEAA